VRPSDGAASDAVPDDRRALVDRVEPPGDVRVTDARTDASEVDAACPPLIDEGAPCAPLGLRCTFPENCEVAVCTADMAGALVWDVGFTDPNPCAVIGPLPPPEISAMA
jgi:hypothetical protein